MSSETAILQCSILGKADICFRTFLWEGQYHLACYIIYQLVCSELRDGTVPSGLSILPTWESVCLMEYRAELDVFLSLKIAAFWA